MRWCGYRHPEVMEELQMDARVLIAQQIAACPPLRLSVRLQTPAAARPCKLRVRRRSATAGDGDDVNTAGASADGDVAATAEPSAAAAEEGGKDQEAVEPPAAEAAGAGACSAESLHIVAVLDHLMHTCCWKTAAKLSTALLERAAAARGVADGDGPAEQEPERPVWEALAASLVTEEAHAEIQQRKEALELVIDGRVGEVWSLPLPESLNLPWSVDPMPCSSEAQTRCIGGCRIVATTVHGQ